MEISWITVLGFSIDLWNLLSTLSVFLKWKWFIYFQLDYLRVINKEDWPGTYWFHHHTASCHYQGHRSEIGFTVVNKVI